MILVPQGKSNKEILEEHLSSNCVLHLLSSSETSTKKQCKLAQCASNVNDGDSSLIYVICDGCGSNFCLKHRHPSTHNCSSLNADSEKKAKRHAFAEEMIAKYMKKPTGDGKSNDKSLEKNEKSSTTTTNSNNSRGNNSTKKKKSNKMVELMVMKSKAQGNSSIPMTSRLYLTVSFPNDSNLASKPLFFNKDWTVGKILDQIAIIGKINNNNNQISTNDPKRLVLIDKKSNLILESNKKLESVVESCDDVILERLENLGAR